MGVYFIFEESTNTGEMIKQYLWAEGVTPLAQLDNINNIVSVSYMHTDHLGTPRQASNQAQQVIWEWDGEAFGKTMATELAGIEINLRFPGQYYDAESGLHYNYFRDYDPELGRYIQSDPIGLAGGINTYGYANQNPVMYVDPTGEIGIPGFFIGGGIELFMQLAKNGWNTDCIDWADVGISAAVGAFAPGSLSVAKNSYKSGTSIRSALKNISKGKWVYQHTTKSGRKSTRSYKALVRKTAKRVGSEVGQAGMWQLGKHYMKKNLDFGGDSKCDSKCS